MNVTLPRLVSVLLCLVFSTSLVGAQAFTREQLDEEQRIAESYLAEAQKEIRTSVERVAAGTSRLARLSIFRVKNNLLQAELTLMDHPRRIQQLRSSIFYNEARERAKFQQGYDRIRSEFNEVETEMHALVGDFDAKFGTDLRGQLDRFAELGRKVQQGDASSQERAQYDRLKNAIETGSADNVERAANEIKADPTRPAPSGRAPAPAPAPAPSRGGDGGPAFQPGANGMETRSYTRGGAQITEVRDPATGEVTRTTTSEETDAAGNRRVTITEAKLDANGNVIGETQRIEVYAPDGTHLQTILIDEDGRRVVTDHRNGEVTITEANGESRTFVVTDGSQPVDRRASYVGGEGKVLIEETEYLLDFVRDEGGSIVDTRETVGRERQWNFQVAENQDDREFNDDYTAMTTTLRFADQGGRRSYTVNQWRVYSPSGQIIASESGTDAVTLTFTESGDYRVEVSGSTDWGNAFAIEQNVTIVL